MLNQQETEKSIKDLIKKGETERVEFKSSLSEWKDALRSLAAFSWKKGGKLVFGVSGTGKINFQLQNNFYISEVAIIYILKIIGLDVGKGTIESLANSIKQNTDPKLYPSIKVVMVEDKNVILVETEKVSDEPVLAFGRAYKRIGKSTHQMSRDEYKMVILEKHKEELRFDNRICKDASLDDIDKEKVKWFLRKAKAERNFDVDPETPIKEALERLELMKDEKLTNAAVLLFGKEPQKFFLQARIRCARFKGENSLDYIDMKVIDGSIPDLRESTIKFIMQHIKHAVYFDANRRYDKWEYPLRALEEILTNALAHREYNTTPEIQVSVFDNHIEVWNPGELPKPLTPDDLKRKHRSIPRNPLIAEMLFLIRYIEKWGRGTNRVIEEMKESKLGEPEFQNLSGGFEVILTGPGKEFGEEIEKEKLHTLELNERQKKAIEYAKEKGKITNEEYQKINNTNRVTAFRDLKDLVDKKIIRRVGKTGKYAHYILKR